ncbi:hypothetical protein N865_14040 [Intrasporangium oryzae NRRL B-24470]|uniref:Uncharacterized protein n=1 Tax=Intrasporangium oryzae NRRL B-24470 TaxID=1386089 RepID=W9G3H6_9MICO|nr:hypothetical protein [Intrasporangium oryzae]EWT00676.1 hypothetical protein N865_14040 [Intrasporangium oryzae NRRL B-24470]
MSDLKAFAREAAAAVVPPAYERLVAEERRRARRRTAALAIAVVAVLVGATAAIGLLGRARADRAPAVPHPTLTSVTVPPWTAAEIVGNPDAKVTGQFASATDHTVTLTVWRRCITPAPDHDCYGIEAFSVVDGAGHRLLVRGGIVHSSAQATLDNPGVLREVDDGVWYWAHQDPGPYLLSATLPEPARVTVMDRPVAPRYGTSTVECANGDGLCHLDVRARTLERLQLPSLVGIRWASPTTCGLWGLMGAGQNVKLVIQQPDDSFTTVGLSDRAHATTMAEGGRNCEIAVYQSVTDYQAQLLVSLDHGRTWQVRSTPLPQGAGLYEQYPHLRVLLSPQWAQLPTTTSPIGMPGPLTPL